MKEMTHFGKINESCLKMQQISLMPKYIKLICRGWLFTCMHRSFNSYSVNRQKLFGNVADGILNGVCMYVRTCVCVYVYTRVHTFPVIDSN
jgi:uncharacterized membrane protein